MTAATALLAENSLFKTIGNIFHPLFELVATVLAFIYGLVPNYVIAIVLLTIVIMAILTPLTIKSTKSMIAMQTLQPELQKLRQKYKGAENREQLNQEMMRLYKENNVSPTGGCLPMFLQMPALIVLYDVIKGLANTIKKGTVYPVGTVLRNGSVTKAGHKCMQTVCAVPRYIPTSSKMYHNLVRSPGVMKAFGLNLASKPLTSHTNWWDYIPYFALVAVAVGLQYLQMSQMTKRNPAAAQANPQMQTMQKIMPLIFAYIYFLVPAGVVIYMIVSSGIRILTQDLIFRTGIVQRPGEREIGAGGKPRPAAKGVAKEAAGAIAAKATPVKASPAGNGAPAKAGSAPVGAAASKPKAGGAAGGRRQAGTNGGRTGSNGKANGSTSGATGPKPHPRSKSKRARKAR